MAYCSKCGTEISDGAKFCLRCGNKIDEIHTTIENDNKSHKNKILIFTIIFVVLLLGALGWFFSQNNSEEYSIEKLAFVTNGMDYIADFHEGLAFFEKNEKLGVVNKKGDIIVEPTYDGELLIVESFFIDGTARVCKNGKYGFINKEGKEFVPCIYEDANPFSEGLATVKKNGKYGFLDKNGKEVIPLVYDSANSFSNGLSAVEKNGKFGFINKSGETIIPFIFDFAESFNGEATIASKDNNYAIINKKGEVIKDFKSGQLRDFSEGLAIYEIDENDNLSYGFVDEKGTLVIPCAFYALRGMYSPFKDGYAIVYKEDVGKFGVIDKSGKTIISYRFDYVEGYSEGLFCVQENDKAGYFDTNGKCVIPCKFDEATPFSEGLAAVKQGELWGYIDKSGKMVINPLFDEVRSFSNGLAVVKKNEKYGILDKNGNSTFSNQELETVKVNKQKEETNDNDEAQYEEDSMADNDYEEESSNRNVDISPILYECQEEITSIQREIESTCRTFAVLASDNDIDMFKYSQMKSTFSNGVDDLVKQADRAFDRCAKKLQEAGYSDAVSKVNEEKRQFNGAIYSLKMRTLQQVDMSY